MTIGERIKQRRLELNLTQQELANKLGYKDRSAVCVVEQDKNNTITTARLEAFAMALNCSPSYIAGWKEQQTGEWLNEQLAPNNIYGHMTGECSQCHKVRIIDNFCPNCGAKMKVKKYISETLETSL